MNILKVNFGKNNNFFSPIYLFLYFVLVFVIGSLFTLSVVRLGLLILLPALVIWVSLDLFWHSLLLYPFIYWKYVYLNASQSLSQHIVIVPIAILSIIFLLYKKENLNLEKNRTIFTLVIFFSLILSTFFAQYRSDTIHFWITLSQFILLYLFITYCLTNVERLNIFLKVLISVHILLIPFGIIETLSNVIRVGALGYSSNEYGAFLGFSFYLLLSLTIKTKNIGKQYFFLISTIVTVILIIGTKSRGAQLALLGSFLFYILFKIKTFRKAVVLLVIISLFIVAFLGIYGQKYFNRFQSLEVGNYESSEIERIGIWYAAIQLFKSSPIYGVGPNNFEKTYYKYHPFKQYVSIDIKRHAHSIYLNTLAEFGLIGFLLLMVILVLIFKKILSYRKHKYDEIHNIGAGLFGFFFFFLIYNFFGTAWTIVGRQVQTSNLVFFLFILNHSKLLIKKSKINNNL